MLCISKRAHTSDCIQAVISDLILNHLRGHTAPEPKAKGILPGNQLTSRTCGGGEGGRHRHSGHCGFSVGFGLAVELPLSSCPRKQGTGVECVENEGREMEVSHLRARTCHVTHTIISHTSRGPGYTGKTEGDYIERSSSECNRNITHTQEHQARRVSNQHTLQALKRQHLYSCTYSWAGAYSLTRRCSPCKNTVYTPSPFRALLVSRPSHTP